MSDTDETKRPAKTLSLKKTETSTVKQSFSHGRTKAVVVEKKRSAAPPAPAAAKPVAKAAEKPAEKAVAKPVETKAPAAASAAPARGVVLRQLSDEEKARRAAALADARVSDSEARRIAEQEADRRSREEEQLRAERIAAEKRKVEEEARKTADDLAKKRAEQEAARRLENPTKLSEVANEAPRRRLENEEEEESSAKKIGGKLVPAKAPAPKKAEGERRRGKLTVTRALSDDDERVRSVASYKRHLQRVNKGHQQQPAGPAGPRDIIVPETI
jgi:translation initiation factor IF-2